MTMNPVLVLRRSEGQDLKTLTNRGARRTRKGENMGGVEEFGYAVVEQAVYDIKALTDAGVIVKGTCIEPWPVWNGKPLKVLGEYDKDYKVKELIHWFRGGGCERLLELLNSNIDIKHLLVGIGLSE